MNKYLKEILQMYWVIGKGFLKRKLFCKLFELVNLTGKIVQLLSIKSSKRRVKVIVP